MKPAGKTPYEIRLELLELAFNVLSKQHEAKTSNIHNLSINGSGVNGEYTVPLITSPTTEEVIAEAEKMNNFISKANPTH